MPNTSRTVDQVGKDHGGTGPEIGIDAGLLDRVECREIVRNHQTGSSRHLEERVAEVASTRKAARIERGFKRPVAGEQVEVAGRIRRRTTAGHPEGALRAVWCDVQDGSLYERGCVVGDDPA